EVVFTGPRERRGQDGGPRGSLERRLAGDGSAGDARHGDPSSRSDEDDGGLGDARRLDDGSVAGYPECIRSEESGGTSPNKSARNSALRPNGQPIDDRGTARQFGTAVCTADRESAPRIGKPAGSASSSTCGQHGHAQ